MALRQVGAALGVALLGSLASAVYTGQLDRDVVLPPEAAEASRDSVAGAMAVAARLGDAALAADARLAFASAMPVVLLACAVIAGAGALGVQAGLRRPRAAGAPDRVDVALGPGRLTESSR